MREEELDSPVVEYWLFGQGQKWSYLSCFLHSFILLQLASTIFVAGDLVDDQVGWLSPNNTKFTVNSAHQLLTRGSDEGRWGDSGRSGS